MRKVALSCLLVIAATGLQGCVAAVIPLAAAGAMTTSVRDKPETSVEETTLSAAETTFGDIAANSADSDQILATNGANASDNSPETANQPGLESRSLAATTKAPVQPGMATAVYGQFADYALGIAGMEAEGGTVRQSALLSQPGILTPDRAPCSFDTHAVLIDLDSTDTLFDPATSAAPSGLSDALERLRNADVEVVWSSGLTADRAADVRRWLRNTALDPTGDDRLLLLRYVEDRKQTRRNEAAAERCLIAMLGDERSDFDELFDYLKKPEAAFGLEKMLGQGWFLAPVSLPLDTNEGTPQ